MQTGGRSLGGSCLPTSVDDVALGVQVVKGHQRLPHQVPHNGQRNTTEVVCPAQRKTGSCSAQSGQTRLLLVSHKGQLVALQG